MALARTKTWIAGEVLTASDLNAEFNSILTNALSLVSPVTGAFDFDGVTVTLDAAAATTVVSSAAISWNFTSGAKTGTPGTGGSVERFSAQTFTDNNTAGSGTAAAAVFYSIAAPTLAATNASVVTTDAATLYIAGPPTAGTNETITNAYSLWVDAGAVRFDGNATVGGTLGVTGTSTLGVTNATNGTYSGTLGVTGTSTVAAINASGDLTIDKTIPVLGLNAAAGNIARLQFKENSALLWQIISNNDDLVFFRGVGETETFRLAQSTGAATFAGSLAWGTGVATHGMIVKRKTADESVTSSAVLQDDDHLTFPIAANEEWIADFYLDIGAVLSTTGINVSVTSPVSSTINMNAQLCGGAGNDTNTNTRTERSPTNGGTLNFPAASYPNSTDGVMHLSYWVLNAGTAGNITFQFCQATSSGTAVTVRKGSHMVAHRVA